MRNQFLVPLLPLGPLVAGREVLFLSIDATARHARSMPGVVNMCCTCSV